MARTRRSGKGSAHPPAEVATGNRLLDALPASEYRRLQPLLGQTMLRERQRLHATGERFQAVYFPIGGICSLVGTMEDGRAVEVATVGNEGMTGPSAIFGSRYPTADVIVPLPGASAHVMPIDVLLEEMRRRGPLYDILQRYVNVVLAVLVQSAACNGLHAAEERAARWLLHARDRNGRSPFALTQEALAVILGVRRATVTAVMSRFQRSGLIEFSRRRLAILDRPGLESMACECYRIVRSQLARMD